MSNKIKTDIFLRRKSKLKKDYFNYVWNRKDNQWNIHILHIKIYKLSEKDSKSYK